MWDEMVLNGPSKTWTTMFHVDDDDNTDVNGNGNEDHETHVYLPPLNLLVGGPPQTILCGKLRKFVFFLKSLANIWTCANLSQQTQNSCLMFD